MDRFRVPTRFTKFAGVAVVRFFGTRYQAMGDAKETDRYGDMVAMTVRGLCII